MQNILIIQEFNAPQQTVFNEVCNHEKFGKLLGIEIRRIKDGIGNNKNGLGAIRSLRLGVELIQEEVVSFNEPTLMEYKICSHVPINFHLGRLEFSSNETTTTLHYSIQLESKFTPIDPILVKVLEFGISNGLKKLAAKYK